MKTPAEPGNERLTALTALPGSLPGGRRATGGHLLLLPADDMDDQQL